MNDSDFNLWLNDGAHIIYATTPKPSKRVTTLAELFLEYYLFDADSPKTIEEFLSDENLTDIFTPKQMMDIMCGTAFINEDLVALIHSKLPFEISLNRFHKLNVLAAKSGAIEILAHRNTQTAQDIEQAKEKKRKTKAEYNRRYREKYAKVLKEKHKEQYRQNREKMKAAARARYYKSPKKHNASAREYYRKNRETCNIQRSAAYQKNHERELEYRRKYRETHPNSNKENYYKIKARKELAKTICPVFMFLCELRATNLEKYLTKYKKVQDIPGQAIRAGCTALANNACGLCPIVTGGTSQRARCQMQNAFEFYGAVGRIEGFARQLKSKQK